MVVSSKVLLVFETTNQSRPGSPELMHINTTKRFFFCLNLVGENKHMDKNKIMDGGNTFYGIEDKLNK